MECCLPPEAASCRDSEAAERPGRFVRRLKRITDLAKDLLLAKHHGVQTGRDFRKVLKRFEAPPVPGRGTTARREFGCGIAIDLNTLAAGEDCGAFGVAAGAPPDRREDGGIQGANRPTTGPKTLHICSNPIISAHDS